MHRLLQMVMHSSWFIQSIQNRERIRLIEKRLLSARDLALMGMMVAVIEACKFVMASLPNIELTSFWLILFTLMIGWKIVFVVPVFILLEGMIYGFGLWWVMYLYAWPILVLITWFLRKQDSVWIFSILSSAFGLCFGLLCAIPYFFIGFVDGGVLSGLIAAFNWWIAGIPFDIIHCIANFILMFLLYRPMRNLMDRIKKI